MADPNAFPNKELEDLNAQIKKKVENVLKNIDTDSINQKIKTKLEELNLPTSTTEVGDDEVWTGATFIPNKKYVNALPSDYKEKIYRYYDIFRENPEVVSEYVSILQKFGNEKDAKEAGTDNVLFYPNKVLTHISNNPEKFSEDTQTRWFTYTNPLQGSDSYDLAYRQDKIGKKKQFEHYGKTSTKIISGLAETGYETIRGLAGTIAKVIDAVGPENAKSAVEYIQNNLPRADEITYPNKSRPFDQESIIQDITHEVSQFAVDVYLAGKLIKGIVGSAGIIAPGKIKSLTNYLTKQAPATTKAGKEIADSFGNIKYASSIAQKMRFWGLPVKYGIGHAITGEDKAATITESASELAAAQGWTKEPLVPYKDREFYDKMTKKEQAIYLLKRKLIHGAEGTLLIGGLTKAIGWTGKTLWGGTKWAGRTLAYPTEKLVLNPISRLAAATTVRGVLNQPLLRKIPLGKLGEVPIGGIPLLVKAIRKGGGFIGGAVTGAAVGSFFGPIGAGVGAIAGAAASRLIKIPPYKDWAFMSMTQGPLKERILAYAEAKILPPLRVRGPWTKEAKQIFLQGEQMVRKYKKDVGLSLSRIDRAVYNMLNKGFGNKAFTTSSVSGGKQHWDDVIAYLRGEVKLDAIPKVLQQPAKDIQQLIEKLSQQIRPYVKSEEIKKEIVDGMGKYLTTSYRIFQGSFKPGQKEIAAATKYFIDMIRKSNPKYKNVKPGHRLWPELNRLASQKVDEILQYGKEGSSPIARLNAITSLASPSGILKKKQNLPKVIEDLMGKVNDPQAIIMDTVSAQAELLSHLFTHKSILKEGLKSGWIVTDPKKFAIKGVQEWVAKSLVPIEKIARTSNIDIAKIYTPSAAKKAGNYWTTPEIAAALEQDALWTDKLLQVGWYKPIIAAKNYSPTK